MTQPIHGLDPKALEATRERAQAALDSARATGPNSTSQTALEYRLAECIDVIAALSQNPGTSNTSGEAGPVAWRFKADDPHYDDAYVYCATEEMTLLRCPKNSKVEPLYAALEPRASDRERTIEECAKAGWDACRKSIYAVCEDVQTQAADPNKVSLAGTPDQKIHEKGFWLGYSDAAKSIARGFNAMEAPDDDNFAAAIRKLSEVSHEH